MRLRKTIAGFMLLWLQAGLLSTSYGSFHLIEISEVFTGFNGDTSVQFIELRTFSAGQNLLNGHTIVARNADGTVANTVFTFPGNFGNGGSNEYILIATPNFAALAGIAPDFTFNGGLFPGSGQIDLFPPNSDTDGLSYGAYTGPSTPLANGLAPAIPSNRALSLQLTTGLGTGLSGSDTLNYQLLANTPRNHSGQTGSITVPAVPSALVWPGGLEDFEGALPGASVNDAITSWTILGGTQGLYEAVISDSIPTSGPVGGSTQWLAIADNDIDGSGANRVYSNAIVTTGSVRNYFFEFQMYITDLGTTNDTLIVAQHLTQNGYFNFGGLQLTQTGVEAISIGDANNGIGNPGQSQTQLLYNYTDAGGFAQDSWVRVRFTVDLLGDRLTASATGSDQTTQKNALINDVEFTDPTADAGNFRLCIRNNGAGNTSTISYDDILFSAVVPGVNPAAQLWTLY